MCGSGSEYMFDSINITLSTNRLDSVPAKSRNHFGSVLGGKG